MRGPGFSRIVILGDDGDKRRLPDATYENAEVARDTGDSVRDNVRSAIKTVWPKASIVIVRYEAKDFRQTDLLPAPQSLINFEKEHPAGS